VVGRFGPERYKCHMFSLRRLTAGIEQEADGYVALCPQIDIASQGATIEEARANLTGALTLLFETADASETDRRYRPNVFITDVEVPRLRPETLLWSIFDIRPQFTNK
jgi:predicted RNase H-like HicB family nuclease